MTTITILDSGLPTVSKASKNRYYNEVCNYYTYVVVKNYGFAYFQIYFDVYLFKKVFN